MNLIKDRFDKCLHEMMNPYFFINDSIYGNNNVSEDYTRCWIADINSSDGVYYCIKKAKGLPYYQYFKFKINNRLAQTEGLLIPKDYEPKYYKKLVYFKDAVKFGPIVESQFFKVEHDERKRLIYNQILNTNK